VQGVIRKSEIQSDARGIEIETFVAWTLISQERAIERVPLAFEHRRLIHGK
jgi:hypothetical protein